MKDRKKLTINPFKSQAQRAWMYSNHPAMAERWEAHTPKGKKLPKKKKLTTNAKKKLLSLDPTRTGTIRRKFESDLRRGFAKLKAQVVKMFVGEDALGLLSNILNCDIPFLQVEDVRQPDHYSCGACATKSAFELVSGQKHSLEWYKKQLNTTLEESTRPTAIIALGQELGLHIEARDGLTIDDLREYWKQGRPVICPVQDYGNRREVGASFEYGHYLTVIGVTGGGVVCQDSSEDNIIKPGSQSAQRPGWVIISEEDWDKIWHDKDIEGNIYDHFGIAVGPAVTGNVFCATGPGGGVDASCSPGGSGDKSARGWRDVMNRVPGAKWMRAQTERLHEKLKERYGVKIAAAVVASGVAITWGAHAAAWGAGIPLYVPGSTLLAMVPGAALAELHHRIKEHRQSQHTENVDIEVLARKLVADLEAIWHSRPVTNVLEDDPRTLSWEDRRKVQEELTENKRDWVAKTSADQVDSFQEWLKSRMPGGTKDVWDKYIQEGYKKGAGRAFDDTRKPATKRRAGEPVEPSTGVSDFYRGGRDEFLRSSFGQPETKEKVQLLVSRSYDDLENITSDMSTRMSRALADGLVRGAGPRDIARDLNEQVDLGMTRSILVARTEIIRAHAEGQLDAFERLGVEELGVQVEWKATPQDGRTCPECEDMDGSIFTIEEAHGVIPLHPNCLPGDSLVLSRSGIAAASKRWYEGDLIVIRTSSGRELSCTPNHPILTDCGWVPAKLLDIGSNIICDGGCEWEPLSNHNYENVPTCIHKIVKALRCSSSVSSREVPVTSPDFHNDGVGSKIAIIWTDRQLCRDVQSTRVQHIGKLNLFSRRKRYIPFTRLSSSTEFVKRCFSSTTGFTSSSGLLSSSVSSHPRPLNSFGLGLVASCNTSQLQHTGYGSTRYTIPNRQDVFGITTQISADNVLRRQVDQSTNRLIVTAENSLDDFVGDTELAREIRSGATGKVFADKVVSLVVKKFSGHVYNLETGKGFYAANGIITHNCRCAWVPSGV